MFDYSLYKVTPEATHWHEHPKLYRGLLTAKIALVITAFLLVAGTGVGIYMSVTTQPLFSILPATAGPLLTITILATLILLSLLPRILYGDRESLSKKVKRDEVIKLLTKGKLEELHAHFYKKNGGLEPLVHKGYLLPKQGTVLAELLEEYDKLSKLTERYENEPLLKQEIQKNKLPEEYNDALLKIVLLKMRWGHLRNAIRKDQGLNCLAISVKTYGCRLIPASRPMIPTSEAKRWSDENRHLKMAQIAGRIVLITGMILLLAGIIVSIYFCVTTTSSMTNRLGHIIQISNAPLASIPGVLGNGILAILGGCLIPCFLPHHGVSWDNLDKPAVRDDRLLLLTRGTLSQVTDKYYQKNGGLKKFVRRGFLTVHQGNRLWRLMERCENLDKVLNMHTENVHQSTLKTAMQQNPARFPALLAANKRKESLENEWRALKKEIRENFIPSIKPTDSASQSLPLKKERLIEKRRPLSKGEAPFGYLPNELRQHVFSYLTVSDLGSVSCVDKNCHAQVEDVLLLKLEEYGLELNDLHSFFKKIKELIKGKHIPQEYRVFHPNRKTVDCESTFRKLFFSSVQEDELEHSLGQALLLYAKRGDLAMVKILLILRANLEVRDDRGMTPLMVAIDHRREVIAHLLIEKGADVNALALFGDTPLDIASSRRLSGIKSLIQDKGGQCI